MIAFVKMKSGVDDDINNIIMYYVSSFNILIVPHGDIMEPPFSCLLLQV